MSNIYIEKYPYYFKETTTYKWGWLILCNKSHRCLEVELINMETDEWYKDLNISKLSIRVPANGNYALKLPVGFTFQVHNFVDCVYNNYEATIKSDLGRQSTGPNQYYLTSYIVDNITLISQTSQIANITNKTNGVLTITHLDKEIKLNKDETLTTNCLAALVANMKLNKINLNRTFTFYEQGGNWISFWNNTHELFNGSNTHQHSKRLYQRKNFCNIYFCPDHGTTPNKIASFEKNPYLIVEEDMINSVKILSAKRPDNYYTAFMEFQVLFQKRTLTEKALIIFYGPTNYLDFTCQSGCGGSQGDDNYLTPYYWASNYYNGILTCTDCLGYAGSSRMWYTGKYVDPSEASGARVYCNYAYGEELPFYDLDYYGNELANDFSLYVDSSYNGSDHEPMYLNISKSSMTKLIIGNNTIYYYTARELDEYSSFYLYNTYFVIDAKERGSYSVEHGHASSTYSHTLVINKPGVYISPGSTLY